MQFKKIKKVPCRQAKGGEERVSKNDLGQRAKLITCFVLGTAKAQNKISAKEKKEQVSGFPLDRRWAGRKEKKRKPPFSRYLREN